MKKINGSTFKSALISGANNMFNNASKIDALNVFPIPDGDTGSNMSATAEYATNEILGLKTNELNVISAKFARGMLMGARGNSGVILSQIFKGISMGFDGLSDALPLDVVRAFQLAENYAYKSVMKPVEGTILTVIKYIADELSKSIISSNTIIDVFEYAVKYARMACDKTPDQLPILKEVGVTDSGGEGLFLIIEGMELALKGNSVSKSKNKEQATQNSFFNDNEDFNGEFGYCTEFIVDLKSPKTFRQDKFIKSLEKHGSSIGVVHDDDILKVHLHTLAPGSVFTFAQTFGEFIKIKSENMTLQANESHAIKKDLPINDEKQSKEVINKDGEKELNIGIISCNIGSGIISEMKDLGADFIVQGGQSMNPSAKDLVDAINRINTKQIIILPNNSNIILVAQQVAQTIKNKKILIVTTKTQMEGLTALMSFNREASLKENKEEMMNAIEDVATGQITKAVRTTKIKGVQVKEGQYLAIAGKKILKSTNSRMKSGKIVANELVHDDTELVTIYYGGDATLVDANELSSYIEMHFEVEVEIKNGAQPVYDFLIAFE